MEAWLKCLNGNVWRKYMEIDPEENYFSSLEMRTMGQNSSPYEGKCFIILYQELQRIRAHNTLWVCNELQHTKTTVPTLWFSLSLINSLLMHFSDLTHSLPSLSAQPWGSALLHLAKNSNNSCASEGSQGWEAHLTTQFSASTPLKKAPKAEIQGWKIHCQHPTTTVS